MTQNSVLFFGCSGFIGRHILALLLKDNVSVTCVLHKRRVTHRKRLSFLEGSLTDIDWNSIEIENYDAIYIVARAHSSLDTIRKFNSLKTSVNFLKLLSIVSELGTGVSIIYLSGTLSYGNVGEADELTKLNPTSFYRQYILADLPILRGLIEGLDVLFFRAPWVYGLGSWFKRFYLDVILKKGYVPVYGDGLNLMSLIHVLDCSRYIKFVADRKKRGVFNIVPSDTLRQIELAKILSKETGLPIRRIPMSYIRYRFGRSVAESFEFSLKVETIHKSLQRKFRYVFPSFEDGLRYILSRLKGV